MKILTTFGCLALILILAAAPARAGEEAGKVTEVQGTVQAVHANGQAEMLKLDAAVLVGDRIQTGPQGRVSILLNDESMLTLAPGSKIEINELVYKPKENRRSSVLSLFEGSVMAVVGGWFSGSGEDSRWELRTPTAVAGVRGTTVIGQVQRSGDQLRSMVAGLTGTIAVRALVDEQGHIVWLEANRYTVIPAGGLAGDVTTLDPAMLQELLAGFSFTENSLDQRGDQVRQNRGVQATTLYLTPEALAQLMAQVLAETQTDPANWENPGQTIFQEPPILTRVNISVVAP